MAEAIRDGNHVTNMLMESSTTPGLTLNVQGDQSTGRLLVDSSGGGSGTVTSVSVVTANGFAGTVATATTTPAITLTTTVTGILSGNGTAISAASTTGSGSVVLATSPVLVTPNLGTPSAVTLTNGTGLPIIAGTTGTLSVARGGTGVITISAKSIWVANSADTITEVTPGAGQSIRINAGNTAWEAYTPGSGGGDVTKVGTPVNNQIGVWTGDGTIEGDAALTFDTGTDTLSTVLITATTVTANLTGNVTGDVSGNAGTVTFADEATDTSCFIAFGTAATGSLGVKTNANLTFNSNTGVLTLGQTASGSITGNAGTATALQNARTIGGVSFNGTANITVATATGGFTVSGGDLALGTNSLTMTGSLAATGARVTKGWFTDVESTNMYTVGGTSLTTVAQTFQNKTITNSNNVLGGVTMTLGSDADGDIYYRSSNVLTRLPKGTAAQVLTMNAGATAPEWAAAGGGGGFTAKTLIPQHAACYSGDGTAPIDTALGTNTEANVYQVFIPFAITANKITIRTGGTVTAAGTFDLSLYAEDGQTQIFSVTTGSVSATNTLYTTSLSAVAITAGIYYFMINPNTTANASFKAWSVSAAPFSATESMVDDVASEPKMQGNLTITAGTPPATFNPTTDIIENSSGWVIFRLDN